MASKASSVIVRFMGNTRQLDKSVKGAQNKLTGLQKFSRTANLAVAAGVAAAGALVFKAARSFDEAQGTIRNATGKTGAELKGLTDQLKSVTANSTQAVSELAGAIGTIDTLFDGTDKQVGSLTETLADYSRVAGGALEANADALGKVANQYGVAIDDTEKALDTFVKVTADYGIGGDELLNQLLKHGPTLQAFGLGMEESAVALGQLNAQGIQVRQWTSGVRVMLDKFIEAGQEPTTAMAALNQQIRDAKTEQDRWAAAMEYMDATAAVQYVNAICGGVDVTADLTEEIRNAEGAMEDMGGWDNMTVQQKIDEVKNKFISIAADVAEHIMPALNKIADILGEEGNIQIALGVIGTIFAVTLVSKVGIWAASIVTAAKTAVGAATVTGAGVTGAVAGSGLALVLAKLGLIAGAVALPFILYFTIRWLDEPMTPQQQAVLDHVTGRDVFPAGDVSPPAPYTTSPREGAYAWRPGFPYPQGTAPSIQGRFPYPQGVAPAGAGAPVVPEAPDYMSLLPRQLPTSPGLTGPSFPGAPRQDTPGTLGIFGEAGGSRELIERNRRQDQQGMPWGGWRAEGGIIKEPTIVGVGEAGPEAIIPLNDMPQVVNNINIYPQNLMGTRDDLMRDILEGLNEAYRRNPAGNFRFAPRKRV